MQASITPPKGRIQGLASLLHNDDPRFSVPPRQTLEKLTLDDVKSWLADPLAKGYMEVTIVGDIDPDQTLKLISQTLGALPSAKRRSRITPTSGKSNFRSAKSRRKFSLTLKGPRD